MRKPGDMLIDPTQPFALYRLPTADKVRYVAGEKVSLKESQNIDYKLFILNKFNNNFNDSLTFSVLHDKTLPVHQLGELGWASLPVFPPEPTGMEYTTKPRYLNQLSQMIGAIAAGAARKAILSRPIGREADTSHALEWFASLAGRYPQVMVCLVHFPGETTWLAATPEVLLQASGGAVSTMSLAGTQPDNGLPPEQVSWGTKEQEEQQIVTDYISQTMQQQGFRVSTHGPRTISTGQVLHLRTDLQATPTNPNPNPNHNIDLPRLIEALHPTPAVSGYPREAAIQLIGQVENYDRGYYTGYFGTLELHDKTMEASLFVNLRCMQLCQGKAILYVGGGITAASNPAAEWQETETKADTLLRALF